MKLILTEEVSGLGGPGDVVEVKDGYGRNFLLPRAMALPWTRGGEKQISSIRRASDARAIQDLGHANEVRDQLGNLQVKLEVRAGDGGRLFGAVTAADIVSAVETAGGPTLDKRSVQVSAPIKTVGSHSVTVALHPEVDATLEVDVVPATA
jgi:large subunit ribosomal protein L9